MKTFASIATLVLVAMLSGCAARQTVSAGFGGATLSYTIDPDTGQRVPVRAVAACGTQRAVVVESVAVQRVIPRAEFAPCETRAVADPCGSRGVTRVATDREVKRAVEHNYKVDRDFTDQRSMWSVFIGKTFNYHRKYKTVVIAQN